jgi:hypothetical protein
VHDSLFGGNSIWRRFRHDSVVYEKIRPFASQLGQHRRQYSQLAFLDCPCCWEHPMNSSTVCFNSPQVLVVVVTEEDAVAEDAVVEDAVVEDAVVVAEMVAEKRIVRTHVLAYCI